MLLLIAIAFACANVSAFGGSLVDGRPFHCAYRIRQYEYGWPLCYRTRMVLTDPRAIESRAAIVDTIDQFEATCLVCDLVVATVILTSLTAIWMASRCKSLRPHFNLRLAFLFLTVVSVLLALFGERETIDSALPGPLSLREFFLPMYIEIPLTIGLGIFLFSVLWLCGHLVGRAFRMQTLPGIGSISDARSSRDDGERG
jgi:hypothetical protein